MKILFVTDAWHPQVNGVVTTIKNLVRKLEGSHEIVFIEPGLFRTLPMPKYPEIKVAVNTRKVYRLIREAQPDAIHIFTEGTLGITARRYCLKHKIPFTTSIHTKFPEYINKRMPMIPVSTPLALMRVFHNAAASTLVNTVSHQAELERHDFTNLKLWTRGVNREIFNPQQKNSNLLHPTRKNLLFVGRVATEKNIAAFCELSRNPDYQCWVVGDGPSRASLEKKWGDRVNFVGYKKGPELAPYYASSDICVFPSLTDTFGVTIIESMACGTPVAAYPVTGPMDIITSSVNGETDEDLATAVAKALKINRNSVIDSVKDYTWERCAEIFLEDLVHV